MAKMVAKLFRRPEDAEKAIADLKGMGLSAAILEKNADLGKELKDTDLPEQALDYYRTGLIVGGKIIKVSADDAKISEVNKVLIAAGSESLVDRPDQYFSTPGFATASRMAVTNPMDAKMSGDFRKY